MVWDFYLMENNKMYVCGCIDLTHLKFCKTFESVERSIFAYYVRSRYLFIKNTHEASSSAQSKKIVEKLQGHLLEALIAFLSLYHISTLFSYIS